MSTVKKLCICALCAALCCILPSALHPFGTEVSAALSPMHFPVLLCGLACGWGYGGACGLIGPLLALLVTGRPAPPRLFYMIPELITYGVVSGLLFRVIRTGRTYLDLYLAMIPAMILGRVAGGLTQWAILLSGGGSYSLALWSSAYFIGTLPGTIAQLIIIPVIYLMLAGAKLLPNRDKGETVL